MPTSGEFRMSTDLESRISKPERVVQIQRCGVAFALVLGASVVLAGWVMSASGDAEGIGKGGKQMTVPEHEMHYLEIVTPDAEASRDFYSQAYGWRFKDMAPELGNAFVASLPDGSLCGIRAPMHDLEKPTVRTYIRVADINPSIQRAAELGAEVLLEPTELSGHGKIAIYRYGGIEQGIWQVP